MRERGTEEGKGEKGRRGGEGVWVCVGRGGRAGDRSRDQRGFREPGNSWSCDQHRQQIEKELTLKGMSYVQMVKIEKVVLGVCRLRCVGKY